MTPTNSNTQPSLAPATVIPRFPRSAMHRPRVVARARAGAESLHDATAPVPEARPMEAIFVQHSPYWKRLCDILVAGLALVALSPLMAIVAIAVRVDSPGPIIFRQRRAGLGGTPFTLYKFRSMVQDAELRKERLLAQNERRGPAFKMKHDPRVTMFGRFIRSTSIDELPQLLNVLKGEMSLVGPRPLPVDETSNCHSWQKRRLDVRPGITCIWQVTSRHDADFDNWARLDIRYAKQRSFLFDLKLMLATVPAVLLRRGAC